MYEDEVQIALQNVEKVLVVEIQTYSFLIEKNDQQFHQKKSLELVLYTQEKNENKGYLLVLVQEILGNLQHLYALEYLNFQVKGNK